MAIVDKFTDNEMIALYYAMEDCRREKLPAYQQDILDKLIRCAEEQIYAT